MRQRNIKRRILASLVALGTLAASLFGFVGLETTGAAGSGTVRLCPAYRSPGAASAAEHLWQRFLRGEISLGTYYGGINALSQYWGVPFVGSNWSCLLR